MGCLIICLAVMAGQIKELPTVQYLVKWEVNIQIAHWSDFLSLVSPDEKQTEVFVRCGRLPQVGQHVQILLDLPDGSELVLFGSVVEVFQEEEHPSSLSESGFRLQIDNEGAMDLAVIEAMGAAPTGDSPSHDRSLVAQVITSEIFTQVAQVRCEGRSEALDSPSARPTVRAMKEPGGLSEKETALVFRPESYEVDIDIDDSLFSNEFEGGSAEITKDALSPEVFGNSETPAKKS
ncbi:MAG: hypothetical protein V1754_02395 [Pseudomonadota bacterium]